MFFMLSRSRYYRSLVSIGTVTSQTGNVYGKFDPTKANYVCSTCRHYVQTEKNAPGLRECPTPGCASTTGFGIYWKTPRPSQRRAAPGLTPNPSRPSG
jgi:hypothetical protein